MDIANAQILVPFEVTELKEMIRQLLRSELQTLSKPKNGMSYEVPGMTQKPIYKAAEVCKMLQISRVTLHAWAKEGLIKPYKIKSRLFFLWSDIEVLIKKNNGSGVTEA